MARGDAVVGFETVSAGQTVNIRPPSGEEWTIHNIVVSGKATLLRAYDDGTNVHTIEVDTVEGGGWAGYVLHATNVHFWIVRNDDSADIQVAWDGVVTGPA